MKPIRCILCPVDFSEPSNHAVEYALDLAGRVGAQVHLVHAFQSPAIAYPDGAIAYSMEAYHRLRKALQEALGAAATRIERDRGMKVKTHLLEGLPHVMVKQVAADVSADLVVMATHGRSGFKRFILGSVAEKVLRTSDVPVLTVRSEEPQGAEAAPR